MTFEYKATEARAAVFEDGQIDSEVSIWRRSFEEGWRWQFTFVAEDRSALDYLLTLSSWPGVEPAEWSDFQDAVRASVPFDPRAVTVRWAQQDLASYQKFAAALIDELNESDGADYGKSSTLLALEGVATVNPSFPRSFSLREGALWASALMQQTVRDIVAMCDAAKAPAKPAVAVSPSPRPAGSDKLYQRILRMAYTAAAPDKARVPFEVVRPRFVEAYPQGHDTSAKQSAAAVRQAWARALKFPPPDIAISDGCISARAA